MGKKLRWIPGNFTQGICIYNCILGTLYLGPKCQDTKFLHGLFWTNRLYENNEKSRYEVKVEEYLKVDPLRHYRLPLERTHVDKSEISSQRGLNSTVEILIGHLYPK